MIHSKLPASLQAVGGGASHTHVRPAHVYAKSGQRKALRVAAYAELTSKGKRVAASSLVLGSQLGSGSFGEVFKGSYITDKGVEAVVLKRVKKVEGAKEMGEMELLLNAYAAKVARKHCAHFLGHCNVEEQDSSTRLTPGLWLMWRYEGSRTLAYYLRRRDSLRALAEDMEVPVEAVPAVAMKQLLQGLMAFHAAGLVHRDVKPLNIILAEDTKRLKFIDLGACADLRSGTNYVPDESILDLNYCPPEQYVLPTDSPHLAKSALRLAISPMLWAQCKPDRFDSWSTGITFMQLCVPNLRTERGLKNFNMTYGPKYDYDLDAWRKGSYLPNKEFEVLDADNQAGWDLARALLRPRSIKTMPDGVVVFVNDSSVQRISAAEALKHRFIRQSRFNAASTSIDESLASSPGGSSNNSRGGSGSADKGAKQAAAASRPSRQKSQPQGKQESQSSNNASTFGAGVNLWRNLTGRLFDLEANILTASSATEVQTRTVKVVRQQVGQGKAEERELQKEERKLNRMERKLSSLQDDFGKTSAAVTNVLGFLGLRGNDAKREEEEELDRKLKEVASKKQAKATKAKPSRSSSNTKQSMDEDVGDGQAKTLWQELQNKLAFLEDLKNRQVSATEKQSRTVRMLRAKSQGSREEQEALVKAEKALGKMERRASELDQAVRSTQQQKQSLMSRWGFGGSKQKEREQLEQQRLEQERLEQSKSASSSNSEGGSRPGFLSRMFGGGRSSSSSSSSVQEQQTQQKQEAPQVQAKPSQQPVQLSEAEEAARLQQIQQQQLQQQQLQEGLSKGADVFVTNSLKFSGMAAKVALGLAADASKILSKIEEDSEAKRRSRDAAQAFRRMLTTKQPPMTPQTTQAEVVAAFGEDPRFLAVPEKERQFLVANYLDSLAAAELAAQEAAQAQLRKLYMQVANPSSTYEELSQQLASRPEVQAVPEEYMRAALFAEVLEGLRAEQKGRDDAVLSEESFTALLAGLDDPPISPSSSWPLVKPQVWKDPRYSAVPEVRRREIFNTLHAQVMASAQAAAAEEQERAAVQAQQVAQELKAEGARGGSSLIDELRAEQARLRAEYDRMEDKLREMEEVMRAKEAAEAKERGSDSKDSKDMEPEPASGTLVLRSKGTAKLSKSKGTSILSSTSQQQQQPSSTQAEQNNGGGWLNWLKGTPQSNVSPQSQQQPAQHIEAEQVEGWGPESAAPEYVGATEEQQEASGSVAESSSDEEGVDVTASTEEESLLAASLMELGVRHRVLADGSIEFSFDKDPPSAKEAVEVK